MRVNHDDVSGMQRPTAPAYNEFSCCFAPFRRKNRAKRRHGTACGRSTAARGTGIAALLPTVCGTRQHGPLRHFNAGEHRPCTGTARYAPRKSSATDQRQV